MKKLFSSCDCPWLLAGVAAIAFVFFIVGAVW